MGNQEPNAGVHGRSLKAVAPTYTSPISALCFLSFLLDSWKNINGSFMQNQVEFLFIKPVGNMSRIPLPGVPCTVARSPLAGQHREPALVPKSSHTGGAVGRLQLGLHFHPFGLLELTGEHTAPHQAGGALQVTFLREGEEGRDA